ncbi:MAG: divalent-cation tolerance protein CutA [Chloroflexi bacterium]|nr:divalent-cation tolerance protein CutA [Chloroflexota bacterium]
MADGAATYCLVMTATDDEAEAARLAEGLVAGRLAACVQTLPMRSVYRWRGAVERADEYLLLIKTRRDRYPEVERWIRRHHHYEVPDITWLPIAGGLAEYLGWIDEGTGPPG